MNDTQVNIPLLRKAVEWAEAEAAKPEGEGQWMQDWWMTTPAEMSSIFSLPETSCGTAYCIAGWTCTANGEEFIAANTGQLTSGMHVADRAQELLGLSMYQSNRLFRANNTIEDVRRIAEEIAGERL